MRINLTFALFILCIPVFGQDWSYTTSDFASKSRDRYDFKSKLFNDSILYVVVEGSSNGYGTDFTDIAVINVKSGVVIRTRPLSGFGSTPLVLGVGFFNKIGYLVEFDSINDINNPARLTDRNYRFYSYTSDSVLWSGSGALTVIGSGMPFNGHVLRDSTAWFQNPKTKKAFRLNLNTGDTVEDVRVNVLAHRMGLDTNINTTLIRLDSKYIENKSDTILANGIESFIDSNGIIQLTGYSYVIDAITCTNISGYKLPNRPVVFRNTNIQFDQQSRVVDSTTILWNKGFTRRVLGKESAANGTIADSILVIDSLYYHPNITRFGQDQPYDYELYRNGSYLAYVESVRGPYFRDTSLDNKQAYIRLYKNGLKQYDLTVLDTLTRNGQENTEISHVHILSDGTLILIMDVGDDTPYTTSRILKVNPNGTHGLSDLEYLVHVLEPQKIAVYPTIVKDFLKVDVFGEDMTIKIFNLSGELFYETKIAAHLSKELKLSDLPSGLYILNASSSKNGSIHTFKVLKK